MNCKFINVLMFAAGAAIGSAVTWKLVKTKYEQIAHEEIESVKEAFADRFGDQGEVSEDDEEEPARRIDWDELEDLDEDDDGEDEAPTNDNLNSYARLVNDYTSEKGGAENMTKEPYVISPYDFGELSDYNQVELTHYADDIIEDEDYNIVNDVEELIGPKALTTYGEYEDDAVFVRNDYLRTDFQILKDYRTYAEARSVGPKQVGNE